MFPWKMYKLGLVHEQTDIIAFIEYRIFDKALKMFWK